MSGTSARALSFGAVADDYDRVRPGPPDEALDWLLPTQCDVAVDLGAGTGLFSRALAERVATVVAVEPDARMRGVLRDRSPDVRAIGAVSEALPVRDGVADVVTASSSWHWMDPDRAVPEIARVLRPGGRLAVIWTSRDREVEWVRSLDRLRTSPALESDDAVAAQARPRSVLLPADAPFVDIEGASFAFARTMSIDDIVNWLGTYSGVLTAPEDERVAGLRRARAALVERFGDVDVVDVPMRSYCWRATRQKLGVG
jgi:SAM-dependent methyltransferase